MPRSMIRRLMLAVLALAICVPATAQDRETPVKIGVLAKRGPGKCLEKWAPTADYLTCAIPGCSFTIVPLDFTEVDPAVQRGEVDFILANSSFYVGLEKLYGANRIVTLKNQRSTGVFTVFGSVIFRRADRREIVKLGDLTGKTFMAVDETSFGGWHAAWRELKKQGIDPHRDFADLQFGGTHDAVVWAVRDGKIDAGAVRTDTIERMALEGDIHLDDFHVFPHDHSGKEPCTFPCQHSTDLYPEWPLAKVKHMPDSLAEQISLALLAMRAEDPAAKASKCAGWTTPLNYQPVHDCLKELRIGPYSDYDRITPSDVFRRYWQWLAAVIILLGGMAVTLAWSLRLLLQRKRAEEHLAQAHLSVAVEAHKLRAMIEGMDEGIIVANADDVVTDINGWFLAKFGLGRDEVIGKSIWEFHSDTEGSARLRAALDAYHSGRSREKYIVNRELLGMQLSLRVQPIVEGDHYRGVILNVIDVSDLVETRQAAEAATKAKSEFLANMSHEIRTPMTAILGYADLLLESGNYDWIPPERIDAAQTIKRNGEYLLTIINNILDLSKIEAGKDSVERVTCELCRIVTEVASLMKMKADDRRLPFEIEPAGAVPETIQTDPTRLRQILINLIDNALKFTEAGSVRLIVRFVDEGDKPVMQFDVVDTGIGMNEEQLAHLFHPFMQADSSTTRRFGGSGLGLIISKRLAEMLGGDLAVIDSQEGLGTRFRLTVATGPLAGVKMIENPTFTVTTATATVMTSAGTGQSVLHERRILLAEDSPDTQVLVTYVLKKEGADVTVKENGKLAVEAALAAREAGRPFDVILMDMQMPVMDGYEAADLLRRQGYNTPIIAMTAHAMAEDREKCLQAGCNDYVSKPLDRRKLIETIRRHIRVASTS